MLDDQRVEATRLERQQVLVHLNDQIRSLAGDPTAGDDERRCEFVCECGDVDCHQHFPIPLTLYDDLRENDVALLAEGHPVSLARRARLASRDLRAAAQALHAQADLQIRRAQRLRGLTAITVHLRDALSASDLAAYLGESVAIVDRPWGTDATVQLRGSLSATLSRIRDWAGESGFESVEVTFLGEPRTLVS